MRPFPHSLALAALLLAACVANTPEPLPTSTPAPAFTQTPVPPPTSVYVPQRAYVLRVAVLGDTTTTNVWALFDEAGADYWNLATQAGYWPSLYRLAPPLLDLQPATAQGAPSPAICDNVTCTATVTLRPGLTWTDGSAFTASDVAFTVNTVLQFRLGLNWRQFYNPDVLDHAEALDELHVKLYFKIKPTIADWQYGVLQGPIVNRAYWQPRMVGAVNLLPDESLLATIQELEAELAWMQAELDGMNLSLTAIAPGSLSHENMAKEADRLHDDLIGVKNKLEKKRTEYEAKLADSRAFLFTLNNTNEPTLGPWKFSGRVEGSLENQANLGTPFGDPWFDNARYITYPDESAAVEALENNQVDLILTPDGLSPESVSRLEKNSKITLRRNMTRSGRFLAFNHANPYLADPVLHQALACMLDPTLLVESLGNDAAPLSGFTLDDFWQYEQAVLPCAVETESGRLTEAIRLLKSAGYSWDKEPAFGISDSQLKAPDGNVLPDFSLLALQQDPMRGIAAIYIAKQADVLGLTLDVRIKNSDDLLYAVYGSGAYDMALLGWRLSAYPAYLCEWFMPFGQNPFAYNGSSHRSACEAWAQVNDLDIANNYVFEVHSALMHDLPLIPLYTNVRVDAYRNIRYPFAEVIDGLGGLYGAPALAIQVP
jgi:ABC-type transport system substrate-binding protein